MKQLARATTSKKATEVPKTSSVSPPETWVVFVGVGTEQEIEATCLLPCHLK